MKKHIVIVGLGLIGGSMARALAGFEGYDRIGVDLNQDSLNYALEHGLVDRVETDPLKALTEGDLVFLCLHPHGILNFLKEHAYHFKPGAMVTDVCGVKGAILEAATALPENISFLGGHPMAGRELSGVRNSLRNMFHGAHYILTPNGQTTPEHLALMEKVAYYVGCADVIQTTPEEHDAIIAYTSQMMHIIAVAVCDDPNLFRFQGFEGDSFRGCTRVAAMDVPLWTQLFSMNRQALCDAVETLEEHLREYRKLLCSGDEDALYQRLIDSSDRKRTMNRLEEASGAVGRQHHNK